MFNCAIQEEYTDRNPATKMKVDAAPPNKKDARLPFSNEQLSLIFSSENYPKRDMADAARDERFWIPLIALFSGMRLNEICQLENADIDLDGGIYCFYIQESSKNEDKKFKSAASKRTVPIHSELIKIGLIKYWEANKQKGHTRLFPNLKKDRRGYYSDSFQKWFSRYLVQCGAKVEKTSFHSFRHSFRDALRKAGVNVEWVERICGWTARGMQGVYGSPPKAKELFQYVNKIHFAELDLSHLWEN